MSINSAPKQYFSDIAPTLARMSSLKSKLPLNPTAPVKSNAGTVHGSPIHGKGPMAAIGGKQDGRVYTVGGYPLSKKGAVIGRPYQGSHTIGNWESDNAVDLSVPNGTPVLATQNGTISQLYVSTLDPKSRFAGYQIHLKTGDNSWFYTHLERMAAGIKPGTVVKKGQVIGYSGSANSAAHLHIGVEYGNPVNLLGLVR